MTPNTIHKPNTTATTSYITNHTLINVVGLGDMDHNRANHASMTAIRWGLVDQLLIRSSVCVACVPDLSKLIPHAA